MMKKLYQYYTRSSVEKGKPKLYAYTINKKYAKRFEKERYMDAFVTHHVKIESSEIPEFKAYEYQHKLESLVEIPLSCGNNPKTDYVSLIGTSKEENELDEAVDYIHAVIDNILTEMSEFAENGYITNDFMEHLCEYLGTSYICDEDGICFQSTSTVDINTFHLFLYIHRNLFYKYGDELDEQDDIIRSW